VLFCLFSAGKECEELLWVRRREAFYLFLSRKKGGGKGKIIHFFLPIIKKRGEKDLSKGRREIPFFKRKNIHSFLKKKEGKTVQKKKNPFVGGEKSREDGKPDRSRKKQLRRKKGRLPQTLFHKKKVCAVCTLSVRKGKGRA